MSFSTFVLRLGYEKKSLFSALIKTSWRINIYQKHLNFSFSQKNYSPFCKPITFAEFINIFLQLKGKDKMLILAHRVEKESINMAQIGVQQKGVVYQVSFLA